MSTPRLVLALAGLCLASACLGAHEPGALPEPRENPSAADESASAVFAGGCFWGVEAVFLHLKGVREAHSGYAGGRPANPSYELVSGGRTGHAESVSVRYDPREISYGELLRVFLSVAHDPTELNRQGPDVGTQYRSIIFYADEEQRRVASAYLAQLIQARSFDQPIVTELIPLKGFYRAESYHQNYLARHPESFYIIANDLPKLERLKTLYPALYRP
jgi:peptide-methionine (S)-S-oxide reductase